MGGKWLEVLKKAAPGLAKVALIYNPKTTPYAGYLKSIEASAASLGGELIARGVADTTEIKQVIEVTGTASHGGLIIFPDLFTAANHLFIIASAAQDRVPAIYPYRYFAVDGGLMSFIRKYTKVRSVADAARRAKSGIGQILRESRGFRSYYVLDGGEGVGVAVMIFEDRESANAANDTAMESAALVARAGFGKGDFKPRALAHDVGFAHAQERRGEGDPRHPVQRVTLHRFEGFDESRAAVGIYEMVATVYRGRYRVGPFRRGDAEGDGEHDGVAVGHHGDAHGLLRIVPLRDRAAAG
jgi:hypothetical protein